MKKEIGLWIDHRKALIVRLTTEGDDRQVVRSNVGKHVRFTGGTRSKLAHSIQAAEDKQDRKYFNQLGRYYDAVIAQIREADSIFIFGPGEAKLEIGRRLASANMGERVAGIETVDKMTEGQIAVKVREHFLNKS